LSDQLMPELRPSRLEGTGPKAIIGLSILFINLLQEIFQRSRPSWCDNRYQGDQPSAIKKIGRGHNLLKSGLGQGFPVKAS
jgi:hypothetical protein